MSTLKKLLDAAVTKSNIELLVNNVKRIAQKIREQKSLQLDELAVCLAFFFVDLLKNAVDVEAFFTLVNEKTRFFTHRSSEFVRVYNVKNRDNKKAKRMTDVRYAIYQRTVMLYDKLSQFAADVACFAICATKSEKVHAKTNKHSYTLSHVATSKLVKHVAKMKSVQSDIAVLVKYCKKSS